MNEIFFVYVMAMFFLFICPYTKVEESFNIQAIHDVHRYGFNISKYDHLEFPGVVPRTFIGPLIIAFLNTPFMLIFRRYSLLYVQISARLVLGTLVFFGFWQYIKAVNLTFGRKTGKYTCLITACQFHFLFYMTRTLPNTFALALILHTFAFWLLQNDLGFLVTSIMGIVFFRFELMILAGVMALITFSYFRRKVIQYVCAAIPITCICLLTTVMVDSYFWRRWLWPEGEVFWYNIVLNKSSNWGTSPFLWYLYSAIPRLLLTSIVFFPVGLKDGRARHLLAPCICYILLFSFLPHKELRFIIYVLPVLNTVSARGITYFFQQRKKDKFILCFVLSSSFLISGVFLLASYNNYPGARALLHLQKTASHLAGAHVYIGNEAAQTGVTRFFESEKSKGWVYNKTENLSPSQIITSDFDFLLVDISDCSTVIEEHFEKIYTSCKFGRPFGIRNFLSNYCLRPSVVLMKRISSDAAVS